MTTIKTTHYPNNAGRKYCALCAKNGKSRTGWGDSEEEAISDAEQNISRKISLTKKRK